MTDKWRHMDPFLDVSTAQSIQAIAESVGCFGTYAAEATSEGLGESLPQRFDAALNYIAHGLDGTANSEPPATAMSRTNYFRETYAYGEERRVAEVEPFMTHPQMLEAAKKLSACEEVVPAIVYANLLVPGQELAIHTDVPEFRGVNRKNVPQWLLVCMLHSGLFDAWRIPILTCVSWFGAAAGGAFTFYPYGPKRERVAIAAQHNSAIIIDTDRYFHGVERVGHSSRVAARDMPDINGQSQLVFIGEDRWQLRTNGETQRNYTWSDIRYSISWKGYCFEDAYAKECWLSGEDILSLEQILNTLEVELRARGVLTGDRPDPDAFALMLVQTFIVFPSLADGASGSDSRAVDGCK